MSLHKFVEKAKIISYAIGIDDQPDVTVVCSEELTLDDFQDLNESGFAPEKGEPDIVSNRPVWRYSINKIE